MECNKEEALRAKGIAEGKMQNKDFAGARKIALKAQQLYCDLEGIDQMLMVCDVHCSAEQKLSGHEMDWYRILNIGQSADEATIKKQYRKFALLLHPDKNKLAGAESAFKLIGEAQRVLLDREKRTLYDIKYRTYIQKTGIWHPPQKSNTNLNVGAQNNAQSKVINPHSKSQPQTQASFDGGNPTFWTACPFCSVRYEYYRMVMNKPLRCQNCSQSFIAHEVNLQGGSSASNLNNQAYPHQNVSVIEGASKVNVGFQCNSNSRTKSGQKAPPASYVSENVNGKKRKKRVMESSESSGSFSISSTSSEEDMDIEGDGVNGLNAASLGAEFVRRSMRKKQKVSYDENQISDGDEDPNPSKDSRGSGSPCVTEKEKTEASKRNDPSGLDDRIEMDDKKNIRSRKNPPKRVTRTEEVGEKKVVRENDSRKPSKSHDTPDSSCKATPDSTTKENLDSEAYAYPDPEFNDFDKDKKEECFAVGQIWATYDPTDAMPRFYAQIVKVLSPGFKLRVRWLEPDPDDAEEKKWVKEELPVSCGKYVLGKHDDFDDPLVFSHIVNWEKGGCRGTFKVYPRKGETWALFKNWDIKWYADPEAHCEHEYEFVEIVSSYIEGEGVCVAYLGKLKGFVSLFSRVLMKGQTTCQVPPAEIFRFSHRIPSYKMTGKEREGVPVGSFELDPACLPSHVEEIEWSNLAQERNVDFDKKGNNDSCDGFSPSQVIDCPEPQFYNFDADKSKEKFEINQIWALYSDEESLPKYYGQIEKISTSPEFELHVKWLTSSSLPDCTIRWHDKSMPICCGSFKIWRGQSSIYSNNDCFSHQVRADPTENKNEYKIFPQKGEVWALYRNWTAKIKHSNLSNMDYDMVEILQINVGWTKVLVLERVKDFNSVFKVQEKDGSPVTIGVAEAELLKFSHRVPAFRLTDERDGSLRGFWEVDAAALPVGYFSKN